MKGYEFKKDTYLILEDEDFASVKVESSTMMAVEKFVDAASIDPIYYDTSYYLAPDGKGAEDVYAVLREAISRAGKVALTRVVMAQRERTIALRAANGGIVAHTLNETRDLNAAAPLFEDVRDVKVDPEMVKLATQLIERQSGTYDPADLEDRYETRLRAMIEAKLAGEGLSEEAPQRSESNVVDLMAALRKSLGDAQPPTAPAAKKARKAVGPDVRQQPGLKLPIAGGGKRAAASLPAAVELPASRGKRRA